ncbi:glycosyltransferase family 39 protein [Frateuria soli]|uniref:glycosyltransferase family 39 protein n=1 Tax=Frateuria soli TaxID=1542730 RepID=UPI001E414C93|nr:glycosyltransferase family 39 protein [Frateuria soli]UGB39583.1 glycosyltransferase family 39 protein [Frateuria soli]
METKSDSLALYRMLAAALLLLAVCWLPPVPIDETRYLAVAWNMHWRGDWLVPWLDGMPYADKPPLLFWLIDALWRITGVHAWAARVLEVAIALLTVPLVRRLAGELGADATAASLAAWLWLGSLAFAGYGGAVMFDMLLCVCVLVAWLGGAWIWCGRPRAGAAMLALGLGLGVLAKGPVSLLVAGMPVVLGPLWRGVPSRPVGRRYLAILLGLAGGAVLALAWAVPAAMRGGPDYANAIFLGQTAGRMAASFAHDRSPWWYLPFVPVLLFPWSIGLGRAGPARGQGVPAVDRFALAATVPAFLALSVISGKQAHYLLPLLPALAPAAGVRLASGRWRVVGWRIGLLLLAMPVGAWLALARLAPQVAPGVRLVLLAAAAIGAVLLWRGRRGLDVATAALAVIGVVVLVKGAFLAGYAAHYSVAEASRMIAAAQRSDVPLLMLDRQNGLFTFAGRLTAPIPTAPGPRYVAAWVQAHPDGWVIASGSDYDFASPPLYRQPLLGRRLAIWRAADIARETVAGSEAAGRTQPKVPVGT